MKTQISNRLGVAHVRDTVKQFVEGTLSREQAMESLQIGQSRLYDLRSSYLAARAAGLESAWLPGRSGGNRKGEGRRRLNLLITFLVSGLWHGADWSFVLWGGIHGAGQLVEDLLFRNKKKIRGDESGMPAPRKSSRFVTFVRWGVTFAFVYFAWIFFRAPDIASALDFLKCFVREECLM